VKFDDLVESCAAVVHAANAAICEADGDTSQGTWEEATEDIKEGVRKGVIKVLANPNLTPEQIHQEWMDEKAKDGWIYGSKKDSEAKTHPSMVPFEELPFIEKLKDMTFKVIPLEAAQTFMQNETRALSARVASSRPKFGMQIPWDETSLSRTIPKVAYAYDESDPQIKAIQTARNAIDRSMPQIEQVFKNATKVRYRLRSATNRGTSRVFFTITPPFRTDYIMIDLNVKGPRDIILSMTWVPFEPGTQTIDMKNIVSVRARSSKIPLMTGVYAIQLANQLSRKMPNLL